MSVKVDGFTIEALTSDNWLVWSSDMQSVLTIRGCSKAIEDGTGAAAKIAEALALIRLTVSTSDKLSLKGCETALEAWKQLEDRYKEVSKAKCLQLKRELASLGMQEGESIDDMAGRGRTIMQQLVAAGLECSEEDVVRAMLGGLPEAYDSLAINLLTSDDELTFSDVLPKLYVVEGRLKPVANLEAFMVKGQVKKGPKCWKCGKYGHVKAHCTSSGEEGGDKGGGAHGHMRNLGKIEDPPFSF